MKVSFVELENIPVSTEVVLAYKQGNKNAALKWFIEHCVPCGGKLSNTIMLDLLAFSELPGDTLPAQK